MPEGEPSGPVAAGFSDSMGVRPPAAWARVTFIHAWVLQFRQGFHALLRDQLAQRGIEFALVHGQPHGQWATKEDAMSVPWAHHVDNRILTVAGREAIWTPAREFIRDSNLVIIGQQSKQLLTYELFARQLLGRQRMAYWGHGKNLDELGKSQIGEVVKRAMSRRVHWWFAYTQMAAQVVRDLGFPSERITVVNNAIDTRSLIREADSIVPEEIDDLRDRLGIDSDHVGLYVGGMYNHKRLPYLIDACREIRRQVPDFHMIFLGGGPDLGVVRAAAAGHEWMHVMGPTFGREKVKHFQLAKVMLMPGRVGLAILDTFALGTPLVTVADSVHSPEIEYLAPGENGLMLPAGSTPRDYGTAVADLLRDEGTLRRLADGALKARETYSIEEMARRFADGVERAVRL